MLKVIRIGIIVVLIVFQYSISFAQDTDQDTVIIQRYNQFYDSLEYRANQKKLTGWIYDALISPPRPYVDKKALALDYYHQCDGKIIAEIKIQALDVFGSSVTDTTKNTHNWAEKAANTIHTKSNLKTIQKRLLFKIGDVLDAEIMYENERLIRNLPYIRDVKILIEKDSIYEGLVNVTVLTKDRFSFGISGGVNSTNSGDIKLYNRNIFGVGHELSVRFVGHLKREPYLGVETFYSINNIAGKYLDIRLGYLNTYQREGYNIVIDKPFYTQTTNWGYGAIFGRMLRTDRITDNDPVRLEDPVNLSFNSVWGGRGINISPHHENITQLIFSGGINNWNYFEDPAVSVGNEHFFANHTLYMAGLTISQRRFIQDQLIYSYGIIEDIPEGFKNELIFGYDANEFGDRHYVHFFTSNGNLLLSRSGYLYTSAGIGGYINNKRFEEGQIQASVNFISKLYSPGRKRTRTFVDVNYTLGIRRYPIENLTLGKLDHIRGFDSDFAVGKQRLNLKLEHVVFMPQQFYKFNLAFFGFADLGVIGSNKQFILKENYYGGVGLGLRLHNENLVFETLRLRLAFYPFFPDDFHFFGIIVNEQSKQDFNSFEPTAPQPMRFQ